MRPRIGVDSTVTWLSVLAAAVREVSTVGGEVVTVTVSATPEIFMVGSTRAAWPTVTTTFSCTSVANPRQRERHGVPAGRQLQRDEPAVAIGDQAAREVGFDVPDFDVDAGEHGPARVHDHALDHRRRDLGLGGCRHAQCQSRSDRHEQ